MRNIFALLMFFAAAAYGQNAWYPVTIPSTASALTNSFVKLDADPATKAIYFNTRTGSVGSCTLATTQWRKPSAAGTAVDITGNLPQGCTFGQDAFPAPDGTVYVAELVYTSSAQSNETLYKWNGSTSSPSWTLLANGPGVSGPALAGTASRFYPENYMVRSDGTSCFAAGQHQWCTTAPSGTTLVWRDNSSFGLYDSTTQTLNAVSAAVTTTSTITSVSTSSNGQTTYQGIFSGLNKTNQTTIAGLGTSANNGVFTVLSVTGTTLTVDNAFAVAETHAATASITTTTYAGTITKAVLGNTLIMAGRTNAANNGQFSVTSITGSTVSVDNAAGVAESTTGTAMLAYGPKSSTANSGLIYALADHDFGDGNGEQQLFCGEGDVVSAGAFASFPVTMSSFYDFVPQQPGTTTWKTNCLGITAIPDGVFIHRSYGVTNPLAPNPSGTAGQGSVYLLVNNGSPVTYTPVLASTANLPPVNTSFFPQFLYINGSGAATSMAIYSYDGTTRYLAYSGNRATSWTNIASSLLTADPTCTNANIQSTLATDGTSVFAVCKGSSSYDMWRYGPAAVATNQSAFFGVL